MHVDIYQTVNTEINLIKIHVLSNLAIVFFQRKKGQRNYFYKLQLVTDISKMKADSTVLAKVKQNVQEPSHMTIAGGEKLIVSF